MDETFSVAECGLSGETQEKDKLCYSTVILEQRTMVKWFPGINMYKTLGMVAESGMDDVIKLLILAGNDIRFLERNASLSRLTSKISIL